MKIANPLYDRAFKVLMENDRIAKLIISTIIEKEIISLELQPQEVVIHDKKRNFPILRYDFKAIIKTDENKQKVVLIEVQKSKSPDPIMRFRRYLASNYMKPQKYVANNENKEGPLPIITIYFLGYKLKEYDIPAILVNNTVLDASTKEVIPYKNEFVELLTHPSYILQVERLPEKRRTKLEKLLSLFDQAKKADEDYLLALTDKEISELDEFAFLAQYLNNVIQDEYTIKQLQLEEEIEREFEKLEKLKEQIIIEQKEKEIARQQEKIAKQREKIAKQREKEAKQREKEAVQREEEAKQREKQAMLKLAKNMKKYGENIEIIMKETGLTREEIEKL
jgi:hypothetical protein